MQLTLASHYGAKPSGFAELVLELQQSLAALLGAGFRPYALEQVHGTMAGLEGVRDGERVRNENFARYRQEERSMDMAGLLHFLRNDFKDFEVRVGGFSEERDCGFTSQGQHPFHRSFSLQGNIAVAMGWPFENSKVVPVLDELRRELQRFGVLHKWHRAEADVDNDFFFVLGRVAPSVSTEQRQLVEARVRQQLGAMPPRLFRVKRETLAFIAYTDPQLPPGSSQAFALNDASTTPALLKGIYG